MQSYNPEVESLFKNLPNLEKFYNGFKKLPQVSVKSTYIHIEDKGGELHCYVSWVCVLC